MLPGMPQQAGGSAEEKRLRKWYRAMNPQDQATLMRFAEFLAKDPSSNDPPMTVFPEPEAIERPEQESVVKAIKRLAATYPMVDRDRLLNETSSLMTAHVIHGKPAPAIIDEAEAMFKRHYLELKTAFENSQQPDH